MRLLYKSVLHLSVHVFASIYLSQQKAGSMKIKKWSLESWDQPMCISSTAQWKVTLNLENTVPRIPFSDVREKCFNTALSSWSLWNIPQDKPPLSDLPPRLPSNHWITTMAKYKVSTSLFSTNLYQVFFLSKPHSS